MGDPFVLQAGATATLLSESAIELIRMASQGNPRKAHQIIVTSMRLAADRQMNHLPDDSFKKQSICSSKYDNPSSAPFYEGGCFTSINSG